MAYLDRTAPMRLFEKWGILPRLHCHWQHCLKEQPTPFSEAHSDLDPTTHPAANRNRRIGFLQVKMRRSSRWIMFDALTYQLRRGHYERWPPAVGLEHVHESCAARDDISYGISLSSQLSSDLSIYSIVQRLGNLHVQRSLPIDCTQFPSFLTSF